MRERFSLLKMQKKGSAYVNTAIAVVVLLILVSALAPSALIGLFNTTAFSCPGSYINGSGCGALATAVSGVPGWIPIALGSLGAIAFVYIIWKAADSR